ncbi:DUF3466 family protein [Vibrio proteolyticus]|uniref:GlyGly-CTERM sorting domain-containing protein n=1 Tax=Vibrio proteolyticus NBRC 13287 TaxID=1219065 RepID=U2ZC26_VIBPR|nr:DUF3466 family protein [Vibrio proteolyticus]GAD65261.1 hypothetical protein VPR01S_01_00330 [Vibrio proteolyticus NBRC 13287]
MSNTFKLSAVAATVFAAMNANAAIYKVVEVTPSALSGYAESYGVAIQPSADGENCFTSTSCGNGDAYAMGVEGRKWAEGVSYREELPFAMDNRFRYIDDKNDFESYCNAQLGYSTCESWAQTEWEGYSKELSGDYTNGQAQIVGAGGESFDSNTSLNSLDKNGNAIGNSRDGSTRNKAFAPFSLFLPTNEPNVVESRAFNSDDTGDYVVGSISRFKKNGNGDHHSSKAAVWNSNDTSSVTEFSWGSGAKEQDSDRIAQASMRDVLVKESKFYGVGYNTYKDQRIDATVFSCDRDTSTGALSNCASKQVSNATSGSDYKYSNSVVEKVNANGVAIGVAKLAGNKPENGSAANKVFYVSDVTSPSATYMADSGQSIFFKGAGGQAGSINNLNELVGQTDAEQNREVDGKPRRKRGFIYPLSIGDVTPNSVFGNRAWILDDLTNDGNATGNNNQFRVIDATDINDAGVISATALKCSGGYDTIEHNSYCDGGSGAEQIVAVKLVPIQGATNADIQERSVERPPVSRSGGSLGFLALTVLGFLGFRKK